MANTNDQTPNEYQYEGFDPSGFGVENGNLFGFPHTAEDAAVIVVPLPVELTVSFRTGTGRAPGAILEASPQLDFYHADIPHPWSPGVSLQPQDGSLYAYSRSHLPKTKRLAKLLAETDFSENAHIIEALQDEINAATAEITEQIYDTVLPWVERDKVVGLIGGEHGISLGALHAMAQKHEQFSILQIDAHCDLRESYMGLPHSHASVMYNALKLDNVGSLVQVGVRDYCDEEAQRIAGSEGRIRLYDAPSIHRNRFQGGNWDMVCDQIIRDLGDKVYISFDIDGLDPMLCPNTGTPVPGGLSFEQIQYLLDKLAARGKDIIGFDLVEVSAESGDDYDAIVATRVLWEIYLCIIRSNGYV